MEFIPVVALALLVYTTINFLRAVLGADWNTAITIVTVWIAGVVALLLVAQTDFASGIAVGDQSLATLNLASLVFVGLTISSVASFGNDILGAVDTNRSTALPHLTSASDRE